MGKPLIGDAQMLAIYETMVRLRALEPAGHGRSRHHARSAATPVALLAATLLQLRPVDLLITEGETAQADEVLRAAQEATFSPEVRAAMVAVEQCAAAIAVGHALAQLRGTRPGDDAPVTVALLRPMRTVTGEFAIALRLAGEHVLPLLFVVQDGLAVQAPRFESIENVEVVRIDANDAVACCRVMQESLLRTRNRWGAVVLHAVELPGSADPVVAFEAHLRRRGLAFDTAGEHATR